jgi:hypothetical protein
MFVIDDFFRVWKSTIAGHFKVPVTQNILVGMTFENHDIPQHISINCALPASE